MITPLLARRADRNRHWMTPTSNLPLMVRRSDGSSYAAARAVWGSGGRAAPATWDRHSAATSELLFLLKCFNAGSNIRPFAFAVEIVNDGELGRSGVSEWFAPGRCGSVPGGLGSSRRRGMIRPARSSLLCVYCCMASHRIARRRHSPPPPPHAQPTAVPLNAGNENVPDIVGSCLVNPLPHHRPRSLRRQAHRICGVGAVQPAS